MVVGLIGTAPNLELKGSQEWPWVLAVQFQVGKARGIKLLAEGPQPLHSEAEFVSTSAPSETSVLSNVVFLFPTCA